MITALSVKDPSTKEGIDIRERSSVPFPVFCSARKVKISASYLEIFCCRIWACRLSLKSGVVGVVLDAESWKEDVFERLILIVGYVTQLFQHVVCRDS